MDGIHHSQEPFGAFFDRSPVDMPPVEARTLMQICAVQLRLLGGRMNAGHASRAMEVAAYADAIENLSCGEDEAAKQAVDEAATLRPRRMRSARRVEAGR